MAKNYSEKVDQMRAYKEINARLEKLPSKLWLGGKMKDSQPLLLNVASFYKPKTVDKVSQGVETSMMAKRMFDTFAEFYKNSPNQYTTALMNTLNNNDNFLYTVLPCGLNFSLNNFAHSEFVNSSVDIRKLSHEAVNLGMASAESYILFRNLTEDKEYDDPKTISIANRIMDLYEQRLLNADKGMQQFGKFTSYPVNLSEFINYYYNEVNLSNYNQFIDNQIKFIKKQEFADISPDYTTEKNK